MTSGFAIVRWALAGVVFVALGVTSMFLFQLQPVIDDVFNARRAGPVWITTRLQFELGRLNETLAEFANPALDIDPEEVQLRFDILWARYNLSEEGQEGVRAAEGTEEVEVLDRLIAVLRAEEETVFSLERGDYEEALRLHDVFTEFSEPLNDYTIAAKDEQAALDHAARTHLVSMSSSILYVSITLGVASLLLSLLLFLEARQQRRNSAEKQRLLEESRQAYKAKGEFVATVSHELRTPIASILGTTEAVNSGALGKIPDRADAMLRIAQQNAERLGKLINDILDFEKSDTGDLSYQMEPMRLDEVVEQAVRINSHYGEHEGVRIEISAMDRPLPVRGDASRIEQVIANVLSNAVKFSGESKLVQVSCERIGGVARIAVTDYGIGISPEFSAKVFDRFSQEDGSSTRTFGGTGIGMSISRAIVQAHDGHLHFTSMPGKGTTFYIDLPLDEQAQAAA
ncbi:sensor histidine kinase [Tranquillimonas alkanivorans]|uniref:histidine kinase n=1 Tax=Tranquillimonas alkanivorans TaxID=441119 RepID=A0A1I5RZB9_9RHOB|nr:HAMP domain-containing sensor histidine kinase [Tranquillimonas alkanivorans]SFP63784.1 Signal transduction histidine kinase [Tranquillimonas alkanivorans]